MDDQLLVSRRDSTAVLELNRPAVLNALDPALVHALVAAVRDAVADGATAVLLLGRGRAFCSGADLQAVGGMSLPEMTSYVASLQELATTFRTCPVPTIAAIHGAAVGGGLELALDCDIRIAATDATFTCPEAHWGLLPTNGSTRLLREIVGDGWARELLLLGTTVDARTAARIGLVTRVVQRADLQGLALAMAADVASSDAAAVAATKRLLDRDAGDWDDLVANELRELEVLLADGAYRRRITEGRG